MNNFKLLVSHSHSMMLDFILMHHKFEWPKCFLDANKYERHSFWITPYNKGNLWKIKRDANYYHLYYGTIRIASCTKFEECLNIINANPIDMNNGYNLYKSILK